jgi:heavy metal sensor kinase
MLNFLRTLRFRLALWFMAVLGGVIAILGVLIYLGLQQTLLQNVDNTLRNAAVRSVIQSASPDDNESRDERLRRLSLISLAPSRLVDLTGEVLQIDAAFPVNLVIEPTVLNMVQNGSARFETVIVNEVRYRQYTAPVRVNDGIDDNRVAAVQVVQSLEGEYATLLNLRNLIGLVALGALPLAGLGGWFLAGRALAPMERVRRDVAGIMGGEDLSRRVSGGLPDDEVGKLARTFDGLLERIQSAMSRERQFTADASHELRSPLAALKGEISVALNRPRSTGEYQQTLAEMETSVDDMTRLVDDLLTLARSGNATLTTDEIVDLVDLLMNVCDRMTILAQEKAQALRLKISATNLSVSGDRSQLSRVFINVIHNAIRYTPNEGIIEVRLNRDASHAIIEVQDTGMGIGREHLPHIFERFYRTDLARSRESGGTGLGLAIVHAIVQRHRGNIHVASEVGKGTLFTLKLPLWA